ncbi:alpha-tocopherol transfer protein-like [Coccinella septempunctata]|uniref:alpha-tocopherol transfer protein-like n=1 Tax=Coccinella septempunctata TaxID=41139 RepID=UPI001D0637D5|nr:alpha-tocopherol transfer protein-like [Coccinella septempunctata]
MMNLTFDFKADDIIEDGKCKRKDIEEIKTWLVSNSLPNATDEQIVLFLLACDSNVEYAKTTIKSYYYYMYHGKNITNNRNINSKEMLEQAKIVESVVIPRRTKDNYMVIFQRLSDFSHWNFNLEPSIKLLFMTLELGLMANPPPDGLVAVFDMTGVSIMHLTKLRIGPLKLLFHVLQEALPCQVRAIHVLNSAYFVDKLIAIFKPLMKKDLYQKLHFHQSNIDMDVFFENCVEADCIPADYGGKLPSVRAMSEATLENMKRRSEWYVIEESLRKNYKPTSNS